MTVLALLEEIKVRRLHLELDGGEVFVEGDEEALTLDLLTDLRSHKDELVALLFCRRCANPMEQIEAGYFSCPECHYQAAEARSGYWTKESEVKAV